MRSSRTIAFLLVAALCTTIVAVCAVTASGKTPRASNIKVATAQHIVATWQCQDRLGVRRSKARSPWKPHNASFRRAELNRWKLRHGACQQAIQNRTIPDTNDWMTAIRLVQRIYPGTWDWLNFISNREGGHGGFVMNHQGSGAGGWVQFMESTYYAYSDAAFADARRRGFIINGNWNDWHHPLGQAITAAYMRYTHRDGCHWCL